MAETTSSLVDKINLIHIEAEQDLKIDLTQLENYFNRNQLIVKWTKTIAKWKRVKIVYEHKVATKYKEEYEKYAKKHHLDLNAKDVAIFIKANPDYTFLKNELELVEIAIESLKQIITSLNGQAYEIKNYIEWKKFTKGID